MQASIQLICHVCQVQCAMCQRSALSLATRIGARRLGGATNCKNQSQLNRSTPSNISISVPLHPGGRWLATMKSTRQPVPINASTSRNEVSIFTRSTFTTQLACVNRSLLLASLSQMRKADLWIGSFKVCSSISMASLFCCHSCRRLD